MDQLCPYSMPEEEEQEAEQSLRFSVIQMSPDVSVKTTICYVEEGDLKGDQYRVNTRSSDAMFRMPPRGEGVSEEEKEENLPLRATYCQVDRSHFFFGGRLHRRHPALPDRYSQYVISASSPPAGSWGICATLRDLGQRHYIAVPYGSKIYLMGNPGYDILIYDPLSSTFERRPPPHIHPRMCLWKNYFIWQDKDNNPLIVLYYRHPYTDDILLLSYGVGDDRWGDFDLKFPCKQYNKNPPLVLPGTDTLLIMDRIDSWRIYNLSKRRLTGETVRVEGMRSFILEQDPNYIHRRVIRSFCRRSSCGTFLVFAFLDGYTSLEWDVSVPREIAYAKIRLTPPSPPRGHKGGYVAAVESQCDLLVGPNFGAYISAEPSRKRRKKKKKKKKKIL